MSTLYSVGQMNQLADALESAGFTPDDVTKLRSFKDLAMVRSVIVGLAKIVVEKVLFMLTTVHVEVVEKFVVADDLAPCNIGWTGGNFKANLRDLVEENVGDATLAVHELKQSSVDGPILAELGDKAEIKLAHLFSLIKKQSKGEKGMLLTNGYANVAYVRDAKGKLWAVSADWCSRCGCWGVGAFSVGGPLRWNAGRQILSRDS